MTQMRLSLIALAAFTAGALLNAPEPADASFHRIRIHAVMHGFNGTNNIQFVELRMCEPGQNLVQAKL